MKATALLAEGRGSVVADPRNHVDSVDKDFFGVSGNEVTGAMVDRVARGASHPQQLGLRFLVGPDAGKVLIAIAIDLARHHHHMSPTCPNDIVEKESEGHPRSEDRVFGLRTTDGEHAFRPRGDPVGHEEVGLKGQSGQASAHGGRRAKRTDQQLAVASEGLRDRHSTHFRAGRVAHRFFTAS